MGLSLILTMLAYLKGKTPTDTWRYLLYSFLIDMIFFHQGKFYCYCCHCCSNLREKYIQWCPVIVRNATMFPQLKCVTIQVRLLFSLRSTVRTGSIIPITCWHSIKCITAYSPKFQICSETNYRMSNLIKIYIIFYYDGSSRESRSRGKNINYYYYVFLQCRT